MNDSLFSAQKKMTVNLNSTDFIFLMSYNLKLVRQVHVRAHDHFFLCVALLHFSPWDVRGVASNTMTAFNMLPIPIRVRVYSNSFKWLSLIIVIASYCKRVHVMQCMFPIITPVSNIPFNASTWLTIGNEDDKNNYHRYKTLNLSKVQCTRWLKNRKQDLASISIN